LVTFSAFNTSSCCASYSLVQIGQKCLFFWVKGEGM